MALSHCSLPSEIPTNRTLDLSQQTSTDPFSASTGGNKPRITRIDRHLGPSANPMAHPVKSDLVHVANSVTKTPTICVAKPVAPSSDLCRSYFAQDPWSR